MYAFTPRPDGAVSAGTPGTSFRRLAKLRPLRAMSTICLLVTMPDRSADTVSSVTAVASTVTDSACDPTSRTTGGRHPVVHKKFHIGLFVCLEAWKLYGHGIRC